MIKKKDKETKDKHGPVIIGVFSKVPKEYKEYKTKSVYVYEQNKEEECKEDTKESVKYLIVEYIYYLAKFYVYAGYNSLKEMKQHGKFNTLGNGCYAILKIKPGEIYPCAKDSICWSSNNSPNILFSGLFISSNIRELKEFINSV